MGKFEKGLWVNLAIEPIAQRANAVKVLVKSRAGTQRRVVAAEHLIEQTFVDAITGDVKSHKIVVKWAKKHLLPPESKPLPNFITRPITQDDVDKWHAAGTLPAHCESKLEEISLADLNRAYKAFRKKKATKGFSDRNLRLFRADFQKFLQRWEAERSGTSPREGAGRRH